MKTITIGREDGCDIQIDDYRISRRHAILKVYALGKMEIVDMGKNGTWVNGVKLRPGVPFPVKRKDVVIFAEASQLNWAYVYNPTKYIKLASIAFVVLLFLLYALFLLFSSSSGNSYGIDESYQTSTATDQPAESNVNRDSLSGNEQPVDRIDGKDAKKGNKETDNASFPKGGAKTADELFPHRAKAKKNDSTKKENEKKKAVDKNAKDKKAKDKTADNNSKKEVII